MSRPSDDAIGVIAGTFGAMVILTVVPVVPLLIYAAHSLWGAAGFWAATSFLYVGVPLVDGAVTFVSASRTKEAT